MKKYKITTRTKKWMILPSQEVRNGFLKEVIFHKRYERLWKLSKKLEILRQREYKI